MAKPTMVVKYNVDERGNISPVKISGEVKQIAPLTYQVALEQVPDSLSRVVVTNQDGTPLTEVFEKERVTENCYMVNYNRGYVTFHSSKAGQNKIFNYYGKGIELISCSRIYDESDLTGEMVTRTLQDIIDLGRKNMDLISQLGDAATIINKLANDMHLGDILHEQLQNDIMVGTPIKDVLHADVIEAKKWKDSLHSDVSDGKVLSPELRQRTIDGEATNTKLTNTTNNAQDTVNKIEQVGGKSVTITQAMWGTKQSDGYYKYIYTHNLGTMAIDISGYTVVNNLLWSENGRIVDNNSIEIWNETNESITVNIFARAYKGLVNTLDAYNTSHLTEVSDKRYMSNIEKTNLVNTVTKTGFFVNIKELGSVGGDPNRDDAPIFQTAINLLQKQGKKGGKLIIPNGDYYFKSTVYINQSTELWNVSFPISIEGETNCFESHYGLGVNIHCQSDVAAFKINLREDGSCSFENPTRGYSGLSFKNLNFRGYDEFQSTAIELFRVRLKFENITSDNMYYLIKQSQRDSKGNQTYSDLWIVKNIRFRKLRYIGIQAWYSDISSFDNISCEFADVGCKHIIDISTSYSFSISNFLCAMNEGSVEITGEHLTPPYTPSSSMINIVSSTGTLSNIYVENVKIFESFMYAGTSNLVINNYSEFFEGKNTFYLYDTKLIVNGMELRSTKIEGGKDFTVIGNGATSLSNIKLKNCQAYEYSRPNGVVSAFVPRDYLYNFSDGIDSYSDDNKCVRVKWDTNKGKLVARNFRDTKDVNMFFKTESDGIAISNDVENGKNNIYRYKSIISVTSVVNPYSTFLYSPSVIENKVGGFIKISAYRLLDSVKIEFDKGTDREKLDFIIYFE